MRWLGLYATYAQNGKESVIFNSNRRTKHMLSVQMHRLQCLR